MTGLRVAFGGLVMGLGVTALWAEGVRVTL